MRLKRWQKWLACLVLFVVAWPFVMTPVYGLLPPPASNLMVLRTFSGNGMDYRWVPLSQISPYLPRAVITSEDARFCEHNGVDWVEFQNVVDDVFDDDEGPIRGASTIPMQLSKRARNPNSLLDGFSVIQEAVDRTLSE